MKTTIMLLTLLSAPSFAGDAADLLLRNGRFYTVAESGAVEGSLAVRDGRIAFLGPDAKASEWIGESTREIDLGGRAVTPGLIDAHSHLVGLGAALGQVDLVGTRSYDEVVGRIAAAAAELDPGEWVLGRGWDQNDWANQEFPTHGALSAAVPDHPVWMRRIDGHAALLNTRAMALLGVGPDSEDPVGGRFLRDADGAPTGVLVDTAMAAVGGRMPEPSTAELQRRIRAGAGHCLAHGLTTVTDMGISQVEYEAYGDLAWKNELALRAALFLTDDDALLERWFERGPEVDPESRLLVRGVKLYSDGALGSRGAALIEEYSDDPGNSGLLITDRERIEDVCRRALASGFQVGTHAIGDRGNKVTLDAIEACFGKARPEVRFRIEHAQVMRLEDIERMSELGVIASMQPTHATSDMPWAEARVGPDRIRGAYAWRKVAKAGGAIALGSDFPVESADPRLGLYAAVTRQDSEGRPEGGWYPEERLSREEALRGFTLDAAHSLFLEEEVGSIEVGKRADLVVFERDIMTVPVAEIPSVAVDMTLVNGVIAYRRGKVEDAR